MLEGELSRVLAIVRWRAPHQQNSVPDGALTLWLAPTAVMLTSRRPSENYRGVGVVGWKLSDFLCSVSVSAQSG